MYPYDEPARKLAYMMYQYLYPHSNFFAKPSAYQRKWMDLANAQLEHCMERIEAFEKNVYETGFSDGYYKGYSRGVDAVLNLARKNDQKEQNAISQ